MTPLQQIIVLAICENNHSAPYVMLNIFVNFYDLALLDQLTEKHAAYRQFGGEDIGVDGAACRFVTGDVHLLCAVFSRHQTIHDGRFGVDCRHTMTGHLLVSKRIFQQNWCWSGGLSGLIPQIMNIGRKILILNSTPRFHMSLA